VTLHHVSVQTSASPRLHNFESGHLLSSTLCRELSPGAGLDTACKILSSLAFWNI
jgi:hypothetical protein